MPISPSSRDRGRRDPGLSMVDPEKRPHLRVASAADADALAAMHVRSWRSAYRGSLSDAYLDGPIEAERSAFWRTRYAEPPVGLWTVMAEDRAGVPIGFLCLLADHDVHWGTLIDNLHADPDRKGQGIGRSLMRAAGQHLLSALPRRPVYLYVLEANEAARGFYRRMGGESVEALVDTLPDGGRLPVLRVAWPSVAALVDRVG